MTWQTARAEALRLVDDIVRQRGKPESINLTIYASESSYREHKPHERWTWEFHTQCVRAMQRELLKRGFTVHLEAK